MPLLLVVFKIDGVNLFPKGNLPEPVERFGTLARILLQTRCGVGFQFGGVERGKESLTSLWPGSLLCFFCLMVRRSGAGPGQLMSFV